MEKGEHAPAAVKIAHDIQYGITLGQYIIPLDQKDRIVMALIFSGEKLKRCPGLQRRETKMLLWIMPYDEADQSATKPAPAVKQYDHSVCHDYSSICLAPFGLPSNGVSSIQINFKILNILSGNPSDI